MSSRSTQIANIIQQRQPLIQQIDQVETNLRSLSSALKQIERQRKLLLAQVDSLEVKQCLQELSFSRIESDIDSEIGSLSKLRVRFSRETLNIGVIGRAGQGKSRLLQSISGLSSGEIPSGDRQHCTGVRSTIYHKNVEEPYGEVWFHSEHSFLDEVIAPYYDRLRLGSKPTSIDEFARNPLPLLPTSEKQKLAEAGAMYEHLREYHTHFDEFAHLLKTVSPQQIAQSKIREYVAQDTPDGQRTYFNYLAVREAQITCQFPSTDVGQIALIDMPGLGDTGLGDDCRLIETLGHDVDIVLFVRLPRPPREYWADVDVQLYDTAKSALTDLPIEHWSFMVLNKTNDSSRIGDNSVYCQDLFSSLPSSHIEVVDCITANCASPEEVNAIILDRVLDYLADKITFLDNQYAATCQERLKRVQQATKVELDKAQNALGRGSQSDSWFPTFQRLFNDLWKELTSGLEKLLKELRGQRDFQDTDFKVQVSAALSACRADTGIPSTEEIEIRRDCEGAYGIAYERYLNEVRAHLSRHFLMLDNGLKRSLDQNKAEVAKILIDRGKLGRLAEVRGAEFLNAVAKQIPDHLSQLKLGFQILANFELSYRGLIQHRIRKHLDSLTPDDTSLRLPQHPSAEDIQKSIRTLYSEALYGCEGALEDVLSEPSQAAYAIVEEFVDRVLRAEGTKDEWQLFLEEVRSDVWSTEFEKLGERTRIRREWLDVVEKAISANQPNSFRFLSIL